MMLEHLGEHNAASELMIAIERLTAERKVLPLDLQGDALTSEVTDRLINLIMGQNSQNLE